MAINLSTAAAPVNPKTVIESHADYSPLLLLPIAAAVVYNSSTKKLRNTKRKLGWQVMNLQLKSMLLFRGRKKKSLQFIIFLIAILIGVAFGILFSFTAGLFAFVLSLVAAIVILFIKADRG
ncbi:MAG: hypothetical protein ABL872_16895 [Lacibacter sp.]